jgi:hypothetical protein
MNKKDISYIIRIAKDCDVLGNYVLADKFSKLLEKNYRYSQTQLTMDNFVDSLFNFVDRNNVRDANGNVNFIDAFNRYSYFGANINNVNINNIPALVNLRNIVANNPGKVYMPDELKNILRGSVSSDSGIANNNIFVSNSPNEFATKLFQFARNKNFNNLSRALEFYMSNAFYNNSRISNNQSFNQLYARVRATNSVITESMLANELSMILGGENSRPNSNEPQNNEQVARENAERDPENIKKLKDDENNYQNKEAFKEYAELIKNEPGNGLESLRDEINRNNYLTVEDKAALIKYLDLMKVYRGVK